MLIISRFLISFIDNFVALECFKWLDISVLVGWKVSPLCTAGQHRVHIVSEEVMFTIPFAPLMGAALWALRLGLIASSCRALRWLVEGYQKEEWWQSLVLPLRFEHSIYPSPSSPAEGTGVVCPIPVEKGISDRWFSRFKELYPEEAASSFLSISFTLMLRAAGSHVVAVGQWVSLWRLLSLTPAGEECLQRLLGPRQPLKRCTHTHRRQQSPTPVLIPRNASNRSCPS